MLWYMYVWSKCIWWLPVSIARLLQSLNSWHSHMHCQRYQGILQVIHRHVHWSVVLHQICWPMNELIGCRHFEHYTRVMSPWPSDIFGYLDWVMTVAYMIERYTYFAMKFLHADDVLDLMSNARLNACPSQICMVSLLTSVRQHDCVLGETVSHLLYTKCHLLWLVCAYRDPMVFLMLDHWYLNASKFE